MLCLMKMLVSVLLLVGVLQNCYADNRSYVWTYEYKTMPKGEIEFEYYNTLEWVQ